MKKKKRKRGVRRVRRRTVIIVSKTCSVFECSYQRERKKSSDISRSIKQIQYWELYTHTQTQNDNNKTNNRARRLVKKENVQGSSALVTSRERGCGVPQQQQQCSLSRDVQCRRFMPYSTCTCFSFSFFFFFSLRNTSLIILFSFYLTLRMLNLRKPKKKKKRFMNSKTPTTTPGMLFTH